LKGRVRPSLRRDTEVSRLAAAVIQRGRPCTITELGDGVTDTRERVYRGYRLGPHKVRANGEHETYLDSPVAYEYLGEELALL